MASRRTRSASRWARGGLGLAIAAVVTAGAVLVAGLVTPAQAWASDSVNVGGRGVSGNVGVRVDAAVGPNANWPADATTAATEVVDELVAQILAYYELPDALASTLEKVVSTKIANITDPIEAYTFTLSTTNTGTMAANTRLQLFDYFDDINGTDTPETDIVIVSTSDDPIAVAVASLGLDLDPFSVDVGGLLDVGVDVNPSAVFGSVPGQVVGPQTTDQTQIPNDQTNSEGDAYLGQVVDATSDPYILQPNGSDGDSQTFTYTVLVRTDNLIANVSVDELVGLSYNQANPDNPVLNLNLGGAAVANGIILGNREIAWNSTHEGWDGTLVHPTLNSPPVLTLSTGGDQTPFIGQIGASGQLGEADYLNSLFTGTDVEDPDTAIQNAIEVTTDFDPDTADLYTAEATVTDSGGLRAGPVEADINVWNLKEIGAGQYHGLAIGSRGRVWGWGRNAYGQVDGSGAYNNNVLKPQLIKGLPANLRCVHVSGGLDESYFLMEDGSLWAIGYNAGGQLGDGTTTNRFTPVQVVGTGPGNTVGKVVKFGAMRYSVAMLNEDGAVWTFGYGDYGALGTGNTSQQSTPQQIIAPTDTNNDGEADLYATDIDQGAYGGGAVMSDGTIRHWGTNVEGEMGTGSAGSYNFTPTAVPGATNARSIDVGYYHTLYLTNDGQVWGYGGNANNRFISGAAVYYAPTRITGNWDGDVLQAHAGWDYSQILTHSGDVYGIGYNSYDSLFIGSTTSQSSYVKSPVISGMNIVKLTGFYDNDMALNADGSMIYTKGYGGNGALGNGTTSDLNGTTAGKISLDNLYNDGTAYDPTAWDVSIIYVPPPTTPASASAALAPLRAPAAPAQPKQDTSAPPEPEPSAQPSQTPDAGTDPSAATGAEVSGADGSDPSAATDGSPDSADPGGTGGTGDPDNAGEPTGPEGQGATPSQAPDSSANPAPEQAPVPRRLDTQAGSLPPDETTGP